MKEDVFTQTTLIRKDMVKVLKALDEIEHALQPYPDLEEEKQKLFDIKEIINKSVFNLDEIDHLVIVSAVGKIEY